MNTETATTPATPTDISAMRQFLGVIIPVILTTVLTDFLFWGGHFGLSVGLFFAGLGLLLLSRHRGRPRIRTWMWILLLAATCVQAGIALSLSNVLAACALTLALAGEVFQPQLLGLWPKVSEVLFGSLTAPARWCGLTETSTRAFSTIRTNDLKFASRANQAFKVVFPAVALLTIFGILFARGNVVFGSLLQRMDRFASEFWQTLDLTPLRLAWWGLLATLALGLFHGTRAPEVPRPWTRTIPRVIRPQHDLAAWQTGVALLAVNALFCFVNTLDALYLWMRNGPPAGVSGSDFLHEGVNSLIVAVLLSAIIIAGMFQQEDRAANRPWLKRLAYLWVLQNFVLLGSVLRRLQFYTREYQLTEKRVYVGCFLVLVAVGFFLLGWFVQRRRSFNWLLGRNVVATFALFFVLQFLDVAGAVARYNVDRSEPGATPDLAYLASLGPTAWPELIRIAKASGNPAVAANARTLLHDLSVEEVSPDWRAYQWQRAQGERVLKDFLAGQ